MGRGSKFLASKSAYAVLGLAVLSCSGPPTLESQRTGTLTYEADADGSPGPFTDIVGSACAKENKGIALFGSEMFPVSSTAYWTSSQLYVHPGDRVEVSATGEWTIWKEQTDDFGPDGHPQLSMYEGCRKGSLVAKIGLGTDSKLICIGSAKSFRAETSGIVYLAMNDNASPTYHGGSLQVQVLSDADRAPVVPYDEASTYPYCQVASGWVEILSAKYVTLTVPVDLAELYRAQIPATLEFFDAAYGHMAELSGSTVPFGGERVRFYPDFGMHTSGSIQTGNPILLDPRHLNAVYPSTSAILATASQAFASFDLLRALGVAFSRSRGGHYQVDATSAEAFGGHFALYAMERLQRFDIPKDPCRDQEKHKDSGDFSTFLADGWLQLCLLTELQAQQGWGVFTRFWQTLPDRDGWDAVLPKAATAVDKWSFVSRALASQISTVASDPSEVVATEVVSAEVVLDSQEVVLVPVSQDSSTSLFTSFHIPLE